MNVLITGADGMLGSAVTKACPQGINCIPLTRADANLAERAAVRRLFTVHKPAAVIHCAAWTDVDGCTYDPPKAMQQNALVPQIVAEQCQAHDTRGIFLSTDYVFSGDANVPFQVTDTPAPLNPYGESKLKGEKAVDTALNNHLIVRTQWLYGPGGRSFITSIIDRARQNKPLKIADDEFGAPTYTLDLATALWQAVTLRITGIVHITNSGTCSRIQLAQIALRAAGIFGTYIEPIKSAQWPSPTKRPLRAILDTSRWTNAGNPPLRHWQEAVEEYVKLCMNM